MPPSLDGGILLLFLIRGDPSFKSWVFTQLINNQPKAYPLAILKDELVVNDTLAGQNLVVVYENGGGEESNSFSV